MATLGRRQSQWKPLAGASAALLMVGFFIQSSMSGSAPAVPLRDGVVALGSPFVRLGAGVHDKASSLWAGNFGADALKAENDELRAELVTLRLQQGTQAAKDNLAALSQTASTIFPRASVTPIAAPVISAPRPNERQILWIDAGVAQGIRRGMVVAGPYGIIGAVDNVYETMAQVRLITDAKSTWGGEIDGLAEPGLVKGTGDGATVQFHFDRTLTSAREGALVVTSGMNGSAAPAGTPFGKIEKITVNKKGEPMAVVRLEQNPALLRTVFVLPVTRISVEAAK
ncbi:hypothetical protein BH09SUM1_BH09SUM1_27460 [soil metagenome]